MSIDINLVVPLLKKEVADYNVPVVDLIAVQTRNPFKILLATILSARTKDEVTAKAAQRLFKKAGSLKELELLSVKALEKLIYPVGFYRNKAKYLAQLPKVLKEKFDGEVPETIESLLLLPGVGRKTANLVVAVAYNKPAICVDTHVHRIMNIWGYVQTDNPLQTEEVLRKKLPQKYWIEINSILVAFGQGTCTPRRPHCNRCVINAYCPQIGVQSVKKKQIDRNDSKASLFVSWNVNGLRAILGKEFLSVFKTFNADIFAVQEIKAMPEQLPPEILSVPSYHVYWNSAEKKGYSGTAVFSKKKPISVCNGLGITEFDTEGRVLTLEYDDFFFVNVYAPNAQAKLKRIKFKQQFNESLLTFMDSLGSQKTVVVCGDLNVAHKSIDLANPKANEKNPGYSIEERQWMDKVTSEGYHDSFRAFNNEPDNYTWWSYRFNAREKNIGWRIDYFLVDRPSKDRLITASIHDDIFGSDHCPVSIQFK